MVEIIRTGPGVMLGSKCKVHQHGCDGSLEIPERSWTGDIAEGIIIAVTQFNSVPVNEPQVDLSKSIVRWIRGIGGASRVKNHTLPGIEYGNPLEGKTILPESLWLDSDDYLIGWRVVRNCDVYKLDREIHRRGWLFLPVAGEVKAGAVGLNPEKTTRKAIERAVSALKPQTANCLAVTAVERKTFPGLCYVRISARWRSIQETGRLTAKPNPGSGDKHFAQVV